jgi:hypothetical protein
MIENYSIIDQTRYLILDSLYQQARNYPTNRFLERRRLIESLGIPETELDFNISYLKEKGLIELISDPKTWIRAGIRAGGIDAIEKPEKHAEIPFIQVIVRGNNYGDIVNSVKSRVDFEKNMVENRFAIAYKQIEAQKISQQSKIAITEKAKKLEEELSKGEINMNNVEKLWLWIKKEANWLVPTLAQVITDAVKIAFGLN